MGASHWMNYGSLSLGGVLELLIGASYWRNYERLLLAILHLAPDSVILSNDFPAAYWRSKLCGTLSPPSNLQNPNKPLRNPNEPMRNPNEPLRNPSEPLRAAYSDLLLTNHL